MTEKIYRSYLEIKSLGELKEVKKPSENYLIELADPKDFQLNKFFYKNIGKNCQWIDRLVWTELDWTKYISDEKLSTHVLKNKDLQELIPGLEFKKAFFGIFLSDNPIQKNLKNAMLGG